MKHESETARDYRLRLADDPDLSPEQYDPKLFAYRQEYKGADSTIWAYFVYTCLMFSPAALIALSGGNIVEGTFKGAIVSFLAFCMGISLAYQADHWFKSIERDRQISKAEIYEIWRKNRKQS